MNNIYYGQNKSLGCNPGRNHKTAAFSMLASVVRHGNGHVPSGVIAIEEISWGVIVIAVIARMVRSCRLWRWKTQVE